MKLTVLSENHPGIEKNLGQATKLISFLSKTQDVKFKSIIFNLVWQPSFFKQCISGSMGARRLKMGLLSAEMIGLCRKT
jgi:hypothetical protein